MVSRFLVVLAALAILAGAGHAISTVDVRQPPDPFRAGSFEFDLAPGWWCVRVGVEYVCTPPTFPRAAIVMIAIKNRNDQETLHSYEEHLSRPQTPAGDAKEIGEPSRPRYVKRRMLGSTEWVEALHTGSDVSNYDTYYLGTVTSRSSIWVTMSVHKYYEPTYISQLSKMMSTLNVR
jgi:hypothetical protein